MVISWYDRNNSSFYHNYLDRRQASVQVAVNTTNYLPGRALESHLHCLLQASDHNIGLNVKSSSVNSSFISLIRFSIHTSGKYKSVAVFPYSQWC